MLSDACLWNIQFLLFDISILFSFLFWQHSCMMLIYRNLSCNEGRQRDNTILFLTFLQEAPSPQNLGSVLELFLCT